MMLRGEVEAMGLAVIAQRLVILLAARGKVRVRKVRQAQHQGPVFGLYGGQLLVIFGYFCFQLAHFLENRRDILARLFPLRDLAADFVLLCLFVLRRCD